ncbi:hypothetical protein [Bacillus pumilus]|nr:hypothetical protein [Bacillus pumilus]
MRFAGAVFNAVIGFAVGGGVGVIQHLLLKKAKQKLKEYSLKP